MTPHGYKDATKDPVLIERFPVDGNLGIATGVASALLVLDVDRRNHGDASLAELVAQHGELPDTVTEKTGDGLHYYFAMASGPRPGKKIAAGLEVLADGKCVVCAPSRHRSGKSYEWVAGRAPWEFQLAPAPEWLLNLVPVFGEKAPAKSRAATSRSVTRDGPVREGGRHEHLKGAAARLRGRGLGGLALEEELVRLNELECEPPLPSDELRDIAEYFDKKPVPLTAATTPSVVALNEQPLEEGDWRQARWFATRRTWKACPSTLANANTSIFANDPRCASRRALRSTSSRRGSSS